MDFGNQKISTAPIGSQVIIQPRSQIRITRSSLAPAVRITSDPSAPVVRGLLDSDKFYSLEEELLGAVKLWKSSSDSFPSLTLLAKAYAQRSHLRLDEEQLEILIWGSLHHQMPWAFWCSKLPKGKVEKIGLKVILKDNYPSVREATKVLWVLKAKTLLKKIAKLSHLPSARDDASKILQELNASDPYRQLALPIGNMKVYIKGREQFFDLRHLDRDLRKACSVATLLAEEFANSHRSDVKSVLKKIDLLLYGSALQGKKK